MAQGKTMIQGKMMAQGEKVAIGYGCSGWRSRFDETRVEVPMDRTQVGMNSAADTDRSVYVLGAGANQLLEDSVGTHPPMARNLFQVAAAQQRFAGSRADKYADLFAYVAQYWHRDMPWLQDNPFDLEECLSLVDDQLRDEASDVYRSFLRRVRYQLVSLLGETLAAFRPEPHARSANHPFGFLCELLLCGTVISFNYDCLVEEALEHWFVTRLPTIPTIGRDWPSTVLDQARKIFNVSDGELNWTLRDVWRLAHYGVDFDDVLVEFAGGPSVSLPTSLFQPHLLPRLRLLKLHGSLNWWRYVAREERGSGLTDPIDRRNRLVFASEYHWRSGRSLPQAGGWYIDPVVVPPTAAKSAIFDLPAYREMFRSLWRQATDALRACSTLTIIGYSFTASDVRARRMFREAFQSVTVADVVVVNPDRALADLAASLCNAEGKVTWFPGVDEFLDSRGWGDIAIADHVIGSYRFRDPCSGDDASGLSYATGPRIEWQPERSRVVVRWALSPLPSGYVSHVQVRPPGADEFIDWLQNVTAGEDFYEPTAGPGWYEFRSKATSLAGTLKSDWSEPAGLDVPDG